jgi:acyl-CoA reductase-like NAD-dependent aldehyde dehydrogenase
VAQGSGALVLLAFADALAARAREISELIAGEMGKPVRVNLAREVEGAVDKLRYFAGAARMLEGNSRGTAPESGTCCPGRSAAALIILERSRRSRRAQARGGAGSGLRP